MQTGSSVTYRHFRHFRQTKSLNSSHSIFPAQVTTLHLQLETSPVISFLSKYYQPQYSKKANYASSPVLFPHPLLIHTPSLPNYANIQKKHFFYKINYTNIIFARYFLNNGSNAHISLSQ